MDALTAVIVDDDTLARDRLGQLLNDAGVRVLASLPDGLAALAWFRTQEKLEKGRSRLAGPSAEAEAKLLAAWKAAQAR